MKSIGIIAEYNPFHNGHYYHLQKVKEMFPEAVVILALSGCFTQRGNVSILDKWTKTKIALEAGVDLVVELPFPIATASADIFAEGALKLLNYLKIEALVFGSESNNIEGLKKLVKAQLYDPTFSSLVQVYLRMGYNYPTSLSLALKELTKTTVTLPNDILGVSYVKAIMKNKYSIIPYTIQRTSNYHEMELNHTISSATAIRQALLNHKDISMYLPSYVMPYISKEIITYDHYFHLCKYKIISDDQLERYQLVDECMSKKLKKIIHRCHCMDDLIHQLKSKNVTYNHLSRMLLYILCGYTKEMSNQFQTIQYIRLLGFSNLGQQYLHKIKKDIPIPIISKFKRDNDPMLSFELQVTQIYALGFDPFTAKKLIEAETQNAPIRKDKIYENNVKN